MDSPWESSDTTTSDVEWDRLSSEFTNIGYREGITAGKQSFLQQGFDDGFALTGVPLGHRLGTLRGRAAAILAFLSNSNNNPQLIVEARDIASSLSHFRFSDIVPPDTEAEQHAREHLDTSTEQPRNMVVDRSLDARPTVDDLRKLEDRLLVLLRDLRITPDSNHS